MTKSIKLSTEQAIFLYKDAPSDIKSLLVGAFGKKELKADPLEWVKTWKDVEEVLGRTIEFPYADDTDNKNEKSVNALIRIQALSEVFNEGWKPNFNNSTEYKWFPWFEKTLSGWRFCYSVYSASIGDVGFGRYFKSREVADYVGKTFLNIYIDYLPE